MPTPAAPATDLPPALRYVSDAAVGYVREPADDGFVLLRPGGETVRDRDVLARVEALAIPPQWREVWVCAEPDGHLQCTGRDGRGRKQYIYHPEYVAYRQRAKFERLVGFAEALPELRRAVEGQLRRRTWDRERLLALTVRLLDRAHLRIGSARYEAENDTYGLTTLRRRHVDDDGDELRLCFTGKSGAFRRVTIRNRRLRRLVREVADLPGYRLFHYRDERGRPADLDSGDVNDYLHRHMGERFSAKDFRTWGGTSFSVRFYPEALRAHADGGGRGRLATELVRRVARELGNTAAVCREYYIHPAVLAAAEARELPGEPWPDDDDAVALAGYEGLTLDLIRDARRPRASPR